MNQNDMWEEENEFEDLALISKPELPFIEFKDHIEEENENQRFTIFFSLLLAIIGAIIVVAIPAELLFPGLSVIRDLDVSSKLPLLQTVAGAVLGAFIGAVVGFVIDLFLNAANQLNKKEDKEDSNPH